MFDGEASCRLKEFVRIVQVCAYTVTLKTPEGEQTIECAGESALDQSSGQCTSRSRGEGGRTLFAKCMQTDNCAHIVSMCNDPTHCVSFRPSNENLIICLGCWPGHNDR